MTSYEKLLYLRIICSFYQNIIKLEWRIIQLPKHNLIVESKNPNYPVLAS